MVEKLVTFEKSVIFNSIVMILISTLLIVLWLIETLSLEKREGFKGYFFTIFEIFCKLGLK